MSDNGYRERLGSLEGKRRGFTTGTAAAAAARAAAAYLFSGDKSPTVTVTLPAGRKEYSGCKLTIPVARYRRGGDWAHAAVIKDAGDDDDVTHGAEICAKVRLCDTAAIVVRGGEGVGTVTRPGLTVPPGESAINPVPRRMILRETGELLAAYRAGVSRADIGHRERDSAAGAGLEIVIYVPDGKTLAERTWNRRLGITGGISIIGTSGVVEPKSAEAFRVSVAAVIRAIRKQGHDTLIVTPGYVGERYLFDRAGVPPEMVATVGDNIGWSIREGARRGFRRFVVVGHIGKLAKAAAGIFDTHWTSGDARLETIAAWAAHEGADTETVRRLLSLELAEEAVVILRDAGLESVFSRIAERCVERLTADVKRRYPDGGFEIGCVLLDLEARSLAAAGLWKSEWKTEWDGLRS
ncbi:MAG: cobalt-precorrin-5B (C(1))-methyltransferase CbiD [Spirochaetia bacterium]